MENKLMDFIPITRRYAQMFEEAKLNDRQLGVLVKALLGYQYRGKLPENMDQISLTFWILIRDELKRKYGEKIR